MKRFILSVLATTIACLSFAQLTGNGFYRIKNYGSGYYMWVCDNTGSIDVARTNADMGAIQLWEGLDLSISEVSSVLYFSNVSADYWNVQSQGTGVYELIKHYVQIHTLGAVDGVVCCAVNATSKSSAALIPLRTIARFSPYSPARRSFSRRRKYS